MIFFNNQLMKTERQLRLFMVSHPKPFKRYEDHAEALYIQLIELVEFAIEQNESPLNLIEGYLGIGNRYASTPEELATVIMFSDQMQHALHGLQDNWDQLDDSLPEDSLMYGGISKEQAREQFSQTDLRTYLEALSGIYDDDSNPS